MDPNQPHRKVLIVEDDFFISDLYAIAARKAGFDVVTATDGMEAVSKAGVELPDIIIMDLMLPKMDGLSAIKEIKNNPKLKNVPFVIITNLADSIKEQEAKSAGAAGYYYKVNNPPQMVITNIKNLLH